MVWPQGTLRGKLIAACVVVQLAASALLIAGSAQVLQTKLLEEARSEARQVGVLLDHAISAPLAQRDYATLQQTLDLIRSDNGVSYLVLSDHRDKVVVSTGWNVATPLPPRDHQDIDLSRPDATLHLSAPIGVSGQHLGRIDFGLSTVRLRQARDDFVQRSLLIGATALVVSAMVLAFIAFAITRHLARLADASQRMARGDLGAHVPVGTNDEIGQLGRHFNDMATALKERVAALLESERQQNLHLAAARDEQSRLTTLLGAMRGGILFVDHAGVVIYANASFAHLWSLPTVATGQRLADLIPGLVRQVQANDAPAIQLMLGASNGPASAREIHTLDGRILMQRAQPVAHGDHGGGSIWFHDDVTDERRNQLRAQQAMLDPLTGLLNRRGLHEALQAAIDASHDRQGQVRAEDDISLLFIDLDDFKAANDIGGHRAGDEILVTVARTLTGLVRKGQLVARLGGDEFAVLCPGTAAASASAIAARLVEGIAALRFEIAEHSLRVGCSIGIATYPYAARSGDELLACADNAMYEAKRAGKNGWSAYPQDAQNPLPAAAHSNWGARIHLALQQKRFVLHYQSVHRAADLGVMHHEALLRMVDEADPTRLIAPADFMAYAERSGQIRQIDRWVFETCVARLASADESSCIAANLSARSLEDASFPGFLRNLLQTKDVDPRRLHIELMETAAISDPMALRGCIEALRSLGCAVHLDDFGSGFNSFARLKLLDIDAIKIDGALVRDLLSDSSNEIFVASMINIAHHLNKKVVAEHVEDEATLQALHRLGVDLVQGFHLARPGERMSDARPRPPLQIVSPIRRSAQPGSGTD